MTCSHSFVADCDCDLVAPEPSIEDIEARVRFLCNGADFDRDQLDVVRYSKTSGTYTIRDLLVEEAEALVQRYGLDQRRAAPSADVCEVCGREGCNRCFQDDLDHAGIYERPTPRSAA